MDEKHKRLSIIGFAILLVMLLGGTYAFFNYTRTGTANNIRTGRIYFNASHGTSLNLTNIFPMTSTEAGNANLDSVTVGIVGDTTYTDGEEFEITLVDVTNTVSGKQVPMNYIATYTAATGGSIGASSDTYWTSREAKDANIYTLNTSGEVVEGKQVLVGYIKNGATGISGTLTIKAYIDADRIAISDTYYGNAPTPSPSGSPLASPNDDYGTTSEWVDGREVFTTTEWNSMSTTPISFKIKAESQEGIWVEEPLPIPTMVEMCPNCQFMYATKSYAYGGSTRGSDVSSITDVVTDDYRTLNRNYFIGFTTTQDGKIDRAFACGIKGENPNNGTAFCVEGVPPTLSDVSDETRAAVYTSNSRILNSLWQGTCSSSENQTVCNGSVSATIYADGRGSVTYSGNQCTTTYYNNYIKCNG